MRRWVSTVVALGLVVLAATPAQAADCRIGTAVDYAAPLAQLPTLPQLPEEKGNDLPFGPPGLVLDHYRVDDAYLPGIESAGYRLRSTAKRARRVNWVVTMKILNVDSEGKSGALLNLDRERIGRIAPREKFGFRVYLTSAPGLYRTQIVFRNRRGKLLGRFGEYFRILAGQYQAALVIDDPILSPGEVLDPRLDNGAARLQFGLGAPIERLEADQWVPAPFGNGPVPELALFLEPGASARCWPTTIPTDASPGHYRVGLSLTYQTRTGRSPLGGSASPTVEFEIVP